jgi:2-polyprenyl-6-hydroxyphenyl methylase/3-demethylubiquinone-9 3-methyltransferase
VTEADTALTKSPLQSIPFRFTGPDGSQTQAYVWQPVLEVLSKCGAKTVFDLGCGNGAYARHLKAHGFEVTGVDPSEQGVLQAKRADPDLNIETGGAYDPLAERFGKFSAVVSLEVIGHICYPRQYATCVRDLLEPGGIAVISTPYHSYVKNLLMALSGKLERHFSPLDHQGMIKFWSIASLTQLFAEVGMVREQVIRTGRLPPVAKSMVLVFRAR